MVGGFLLMSGRDAGRILRRVAVLGSTGTIGRLTLDVVGRFPGRFTISSLATWKNVELLAEQARAWNPRAVAIGDPTMVQEFRGRVGPSWQGEILEGPAGLVAAAVFEADVVVNGLVGAGGLEPSLAALRAGRILALANKESLVIGGELLKRAAQEGGGRILPVDSEHSGLMQCLDGKGTERVERVILTASGGPFRTWPRERIETARGPDAMKHPTWRMGPRITVDSATLLNKGFEIHEAHWLFDIPAGKIDVWIHPQSIVHALVEWPDGSLLAQLSVADMRLPIQVALCSPERIAGDVARCDLTQIGRLDFEPVDPDRYPCLGLARRALQMGETAPAVLNAADEILVSAFLEGRIRFTDIARLLARLLEDHRVEPVRDLETILRADRSARSNARTLLGTA
jgi:1-deoxy-D-xylulose-5-phosphate reductoisomerase